MIGEQDTDYAYKDDLIRNYINLIIHEALKMQPSENSSNHKNAASRITSVFLELLERQFPIENTENSLQLKTAQDFANRLAVHVNHLNRSVKEVTGKSTTTHISERIISEAKALLQHTDWSIAEIAYALGLSVSRETERKRLFCNCINDGSWPAVHALQQECTNRLKGALPKRQGTERSG